MTEIQEMIDNKKELVNKVCTQYAYGKECKYGDTCKTLCFIKESAKHMQNTSNADVILALMWKEDVREINNLDGAFLGGNVCMDTFYRMIQNTPYKNEVMKLKLKIDKDIKEEGMYIIMSTPENSHLG